MLWCALQFPSLALDDIERGSPADGGLPIAVCDRSQVLQVNAAARACGVQPGLKRATALALAPGLQLRDRDPAAEAACLAQIAAWAAQFTPAVSLQPADDPGVEADGLLLEIEASQRLFGGREALLEQLRGGVRELGFAARSACAPTATGAWLLAGAHDGACADSQAALNARLAALPVTCLVAARPHAATLATVGACTVRDLAALPRAGLARRFGKALLDELDRALGRQPEPRAWIALPDTFEASLELMAQVEHVEPLLFAAQRLLLQLCGWLAARQAAVRACVLQADHDRRGRHARPPSCWTVRLAEPARDPQRLLAVLREQLGRQALPAPAHTLRLRCDDVLPMPAGSAALFPSAQTLREGLGRLVERLQARLGREQVQRLQALPDHRPEAAVRIVRLDGLDGLGGADDGRGATGLPADAIPPDPAQRPVEIAGLPRPLWLLHTPQPLAERQQRPWLEAPLTLVAGPERIESGWWDECAVRRDYFIAEGPSHALYWIFRERLPGTGRRHGWFLHGRFG